jgi:cephalosporin hydroxylase
MRFRQTLNAFFSNQAITNKRPVVNENCSEFEVNNWIISDFVVNTLLPLVDFNPYPLNELMLMSGALCRLHPACLFEWGTHIGKSARIFYETAQKFNLETEIHSIDLPDDVPHQEHPGNQRGILVRKIKAVHLYQGDGLSVSVSIARSLKPDTKILFFLDGDHSYESVFRELTGIIREFPAANILVHDTFYQSPKSQYNIGPYQAIKNVINSIPNSYKTLSANTGLPGMTLLYHSDFNDNDDSRR